MSIRDGEGRAELVVVVVVGPWAQKRWPSNRLDHIKAANVPTSVNLLLLAH